MKKFLFVVVCFISLVNFLVAGGSKDGKPLEIRLSSRWGGEDTLSAYFRSKIDEFNALNNGIKIIGDHVTEEKVYLDKLASQFASGTQPDIFIEYGGTRIRDYVEGGILLDVSSYLDADPDWKDSFLPLFGKWKFDSPKGIYGVPVMLYAIVLYSNEALLNKYNVSVPKTLKELESVSAILVENGETPFLLGEKNNFRAGHLLNNLLLKSYGPKSVVALANRSLAYDSDKMIALYAKIKEFNDKGYFGQNAVGVDNNGEKTAFLTGQSAFRWDGAWFIGEINQSIVANDVVISTFPVINPEYAGAFQGGAGQGFSITKSKDKTRNDAAMVVVKYLTSQEYYAGLEKVSNGGIYPVKFDSLSDTKIDKLTVAVKEVISNATSYTDDVQNYDPETHMLNTVRTALQGLFVGDSAQICAANIVNKIEIKK